MAAQKASNGHHSNGTTNGAIAPSPSLAASKITSNNCTFPPKEASKGSTAARSSGNKILTILGHLLRTLILDIPLMLLFALYVSAVVLEDSMITYMIPQVELMKWTEKRQAEEVTYYSRNCRPTDISTNSTQDLKIRDEMDATECMEHMLHHGVSIYSSILSNETAKRARDFILERNLVETGFGVIANDNRYSFGLQANSHPSIQQALKEISQHKQLQAALRKIAGPNPAVVEFTGITSTYGAKTQYYHQDVVPAGSAFNFARSFVPTYSLFIPLQDTTAAMGSTEVCPGTHQCNGDIEHVCSKKGGGLLVSGKKGVWKTGDGALVNQQLYHRGTGHSDQHGPARVLFILTFAGRPRFDKNQLETRMIGHQGSYSLRWNHWGHTMDDFANAARHMTEPWLTLRALGLYKPPGRDWGWDFATVASMRMANDESGFSEGTLEEFVDDNGGFTLLPSFLKEKRKTNDEWPTYLLRSVQKIHGWLRETNVKVLIGYLTAVAAINLIMWLFGFEGRGKSVRRAMGRLIVTYGLVMIMGFVVLRRISSSQWAHNIRHGKAFRGYRTPINTTQPATLPFDMDVLTQTRHQTSYLASTSQILDYSHPGNINWKHLVNQNSVSYHHLPLSAKVSVAKMVLKEIRTNYYARMLKQDGQGKWVDMSEEEALYQTHADLLKASSKDFDFCLTQIHFLQGELDGGVWRDTSLHRSHIPSLLRALQMQLTGRLSQSAQPSNSINSRYNTRTSSQSLKIESAMPKLSLKAVAAQRHNFKVTTIPPQREPNEPYLGAWIHEGDYVTARYHCDDEVNEWYRAIVTNVNLLDATYGIRYDDGEDDSEFWSACIRPFTPYDMYEPVGVEIDGVFYNGRIIGVHDDFQYDVETYKMGIQSNVSGTFLRRFMYDLGPGSAVQAKRTVHDYWLPAKVTAVHDDDSFDIVYENGVEEFRKTLALVRLDPRSILK